MSEFPVWLMPSFLPTGQTRQVRLLENLPDVVIPECIAAAHKRNREEFEARVAASGLTAEEYTARRRRDHARKRRARRRAKAK